MTQLQMNFQCNLFSIPAVRTFQYVTGLVFIPTVYVTVVLTVLRHEQGKV